MSFGLSRPGQCYFYPRPLRGGRRIQDGRDAATMRISIHALCEEGDPRPEARRPRASEFLSTPSARRATSWRCSSFLSSVISIHALCEEGDHEHKRLSGRQGNFYPRPLRGGRRLRVMSKRGTWLFLSTPSARRATVIPPNATGRSSNFYPRPLRGGRRFAEKSMFTRSYFYPRPLRGGRRKHAAHGSADTDFYPRPLRGGRPFNRRQRAGHNPLFLSTPSARRATPSCPLRCPCRSAFLSTPSARRATCNAWSHGVAIGISIHALCEEGDHLGGGRKPRPADFYPRPPRGGRRQSAGCPHRTDDFYPRPPRGGRRGEQKVDLELAEFLSTPSARRATLGITDDTDAS